MVIYGTRLFGKVDAVPGLGHVATKFFHLDYVPLIPAGSYLIVSQAGNRWQGLSIPLSLKSILVAWCRVAAIVVGAIGAIATVVTLTGRHATVAADWLPAAVAAVVGLGLAVFSWTHKSVTRASYARACQLARLAKVNNAFLATLATAYGQPPPTFGFEPVMAAPAVPPRPVVVPALPVAVPADVAEPVFDVELDADDVPSPPTAAQPLQETRRHG